MSSLNIICIICLSELTLSDMPTEILGCGHVFHKDCIVPWLGKNDNRCPICKRTCVQTSKKSVYLSSQPNLEPIMDNIRIEFNQALQKSQRDFQESTENRIALFEKSLLDQIEKIHLNFNEERSQYKKTEKDWLASYSKLQAIIIILAAYIVFMSAIADNFASWFLFFALIEEAILAKEREINEQKKLVSQLRD